MRENEQIDTKNKTNAQITRDDQKKITNLITKENDQITKENENYQIKIQTSSRERMTRSRKRTNTKLVLRSQDLFWHKMVT